MSTTGSRRSGELSMRGSRTFTTYMNIEPGKGNERALSQLETQTNRALKRMQETASRASAAVTTGAAPSTVGSSATAQLRAQAAAERVRATAIQASTRATRQADAATRRAAGGMLLESNAARAASRETSRLERSFRLMSVAANVAQGPLGPVAGRLSAMATAIRELTGVRLGIVGAAAGLATFTRYASTTQDLVARLRPLYESQAQVNAAFADTQYIAERTRVGLEPIVDLYSRLTLAGRDLGISQSRVSRLTEIASKAAKLSGGTSVSQEAGLYQFAQGIGSNTLQGDELRSVRENTLRLAKAIADGLGVPIAELKRLGKEGKLTATVVEEALVKSAAQIEEEYARLPVTISSATTKLSNAFFALVKNTDDATGVAGGFANAISFAADNLSLIVKALGAVVIAYSGFRAANMIQDTNRRITAWQAERQEILRNANEAKAAAATARRSSGERIVALRQERTALKQQIVAEQELANAKRRNALALNSRLTRGAGFISGEAADVAAYRRAMDEARVAQDNLSASKNRLKNVSGELRNETVVLTGATGRFRAAQAAASSAAISFGRSVRGLIAAINPLGIALSLGIGLLIEFAFRQSAAAGSADRMAEAQNRLGRFVDDVTGKVREQNAALVQNEILQSKQRAKDAKEERRKIRSNLSFGGEGLGGLLTNVTNLDPRVRDIRDRVRQGYNAVDAARELSKLKGLNQTSQAAVVTLTAQLSDITRLAQEELQGNSAAALLSGKGSAEDRRRAFGNFTGEDVNLNVSRRTAENDEKVAKARSSRAKATDEAAKAERELAKAERQTDARANIVGRYEDQAPAIAKAEQDKRRLQRLVGEMMVLRDEFGEAVTGKDGNVIKRQYTQDMADADKAAIDYGVRQPIRDAIEEQQRGLEISRLRLDGYELEAQALERALAIQDAMGAVSSDELDSLLVNIERQEKINDLLASRERQVSQILDVAQQTRDSFEEMLVGLRKDPLGSLKNFGNSLIDNAARIQARQLTEKIFAGSDEKLRELVRGNNGFERAADILADNVKKAAASVDPLTTANDNLASATERAAERINAAADRIATGGVEGLAPSTTLSRADEAAKTAAQAVTGASDVVKAVTGGSGGGILGTVKAAAAAATGVAAVAGAAPQAASNDNGTYVDASGVTHGPPIEVARSRSKQGQAGAPVPTGTQAYNVVFERLGEKLDKTFKSGTFFKGIGKGVGTALGGAAEGSAASGIASMLGIKQSSTGAAIGGAIGSLIPGVGGIIGGLVGGTLGGLLQKGKAGAVSIGSAGGTAAQTGKAGYASRISEVTGAGGGVADQINRIASALNAEIGNFSVAIGKGPENFRVSASGSASNAGAYKPKNRSDIIYDGPDEAEAVRVAVRNALQDGAIKGISEASQRIIQAGGDIERAIMKAVAIEDIPKRLLARTDPVRAAVNNLNAEFTKLIGYLQEGGASASQFADAQKLYDLERADAIEQATNQATAAYQAFLDEMKGGSSSPFNKRTVYNNASERLASFRGDLAAGKTVNQNDLLSAARDFQNASSELNGSSQQFFSDFNDLFELLSKARDNVTAGASGDPLPGSPFDNDAIQALINSAAAATDKQTGVLSEKLDSVIRAIERSGLSVSGGSGSSSGGAFDRFDLLPGLRLASK